MREPGAYSKCAASSINQCAPPAYGTMVTLGYVSPRLNCLPCISTQAYSCALYGAKKVSRVAFTLRDGVALTWLGLGVGLGLGAGLVLGLVLGRGSGSPARRRWLARSARRIFSCSGYRL